MKAVHRTYMPMTYMKRTMPAMAVFVLSWVFSLLNIHESQNATLMLRE